MHIICLLAELRGSLHGPHGIPRTCSRRSADNRGYAPDYRIPSTEIPRKFHGLPRKAAASSGIPWRPMAQATQFPWQCPRQGLRQLPRHHPRPAAATLGRSRKHLRTSTESPAETPADTRRHTHGNIHEHANLNPRTYPRKHPWTPTDTSAGNNCGHSHVDPRTRLREHPRKHPKCPGTAVAIAADFRGRSWYLLRVGYLP